MNLHVLDLFSGTGGWSEAFRERGHYITRIDNDPRFNCVPGTSIQDVLELDVSGWRPIDVLLASPPCQAFSLGAGGTHIAAFSNCRDCGKLLRKWREKWEGCEHGNAGATRLLPVSDFGRLSIRLVHRTFEIINQVQPKFWWIENPNGGMIHFVPPSIPRVQVTYCQYGESRMKLTNLWGNWPDTWHPRPRCKNGDPCHEPAKRGAKTGTQGLKNAVDRAIVPYDLSLEVCLACEEAAG